MIGPKGELGRRNGSEMSTYANKGMNGERERVCKRDIKDKQADLDDRLL